MAEGMLWQLNISKYNVEFEVPVFIMIIIMLTHNSIQYLGQLSLHRLH